MNTIILVILGIILALTAVVVLVEYPLTSTVTNAEYDVVLDRLFSGKMSWNDRYIEGSGYEVYYAGGVRGFSINGEKGFSLTQRLKFFKRFKQRKDENRAKKLEEALNLKSVREEVESKQFYITVDRVIK